MSVSDVQFLNDDADDREDDEDYEQSLALFCKKGKGKKKAGRRSNWSKASVNDLIDIVVNDSRYKQKLIFVNTKHQTNGEIYKAILPELKKRASARGENLTFSVTQLRTKFKKCVSVCKQAAMTIKTATGIERFQEEQELGEWFNQLFPIIRTRDSCQPEHAVEPSSSEGVERSTNDNASLSPGPDDETDSSTSTNMFIPIKSGQKKIKKKADVSSTTLEVLGLMKDVIKNDPTKDLIELMRSEMEQSRKQEMSILQVLLNSNSNVVCSGQMNQSSSMYHGNWETDPPFGSDPSRNTGIQGFSDTWQGGFNLDMTNQSRMMGASSRSPSPMQQLANRSYSPGPTMSAVRGEHPPTYQLL